MFNLKFFKTSLCFSNNSSFIKNNINLVSWMSFLYALIFWRNIHQDLVFLASLQSMKYLNTFYQKRPYWIWYCYFISIYIFYWNRFFTLMKLFFSILISLNFIIFSIFIYAFKNLYIFEIYISLYLNLRRNWFGPTGLLYEMLSTEMFSYNFLFNKMLLKPIFVH